jgi:translation elongation factor EF-4
MSLLQRHDATRTHSPRRNFSIIAHIGIFLSSFVSHAPTFPLDHGKSTLADRSVDLFALFVCSPYLRGQATRGAISRASSPDIASTLVQLTGTIPNGAKGSNQQVLDKLKVERERGITGEALNIGCKDTLSYDTQSRRRRLGDHLVLPAWNCLIVLLQYDTWSRHEQVPPQSHRHPRKYPTSVSNLVLIIYQGHVDFSWEVSRSLAASQGALLLVDATQGVQAQSISVFHIAKERGLTVIPVLNKVRQFEHCWSSRFFNAHQRR